MENINDYSPQGGNIVGADNQLYNVVDLLGGGTPVDDKLYDVTQFQPKSGLVIGSDNRMYDLVDLLTNTSSNISGNQFGLVKYVEQSLTDEQKAQARENIKAADSETVSQIKDDIGNKLPKSPAEWEAWTDAEKAVARERLGAAAIGGGSNQGTDKVEKFTVKSLSDKVENGLVCYRFGGFHVISGWFRFNAQPTNEEFIFALESLSIKSLSVPITCIEENGIQHIILWLRADGLIKYSSNTEKNINSPFIVNCAFI